MRRSFKASFPIESIDNWIYERSIIDSPTLAEIQASIQRSGVVTPIIVRRNKDKTHQGLGGFLRVTASGKLGKTEVPAIIYSGIDDLTAMDICLIDNVQHAEMSDWDIAKCLEVYRVEGLQLEDIATRIQKSTSYISQKLAVLKDSLSIQQAVEEGRISESQARYVRRLPEELHTQVIEEVEEMTVTDTRKAVIQAQDDNKAVLVKAEIREVEAEIEGLTVHEKTREKLKSEVSSLEGKLKALVVENKQMNGILRTVETLEKDYFPLIKELEAYTTELQDTKKMLPDYDVDELVKDRKGLDTEIGKQDAEINKLSKKLKTMKKDRDSNKKARKLVQEKISEYNERKRKVTELTTLTGKLNKKKAKMDDKLGDQVNKFEELKATLDEYNQQVLTQRLQHSKDIANMKKKVGSLNGKIGQRSRLEGDLKRLNEELELLEQAETVEATATA